MSERPTQLYSGIKGDLKRQVLFKGSFVAVIGILLWIVVGSTMPTDKLTQWGGPVFLLGGALIALGLVPYRRLSQVEAHPYHLTLHPEGVIDLTHKGKVRCSVPAKAITKTAYYEAPGIYGIAIWLKPGTLSDAYCAKTQKRYHCDLFLPYFGRHAFDSLKQWI